MAGLYKKTSFMSKSCKNYLKFQISNLQVYSKFKLIHFFSRYSLRKLNERSGKTRVYTFPFLTKIVTTQI